VRSRGGLIRVAKEPKHSKISVRHELVMEEGKGDSKLKRLAKAAVEEVGGGAESLGPIWRWHVCLE
jgi:hypothetical protein